MKVYVKFKVLNSGAEIRVDPDSVIRLSEVLDSLQSVRTPADVNRLNKPGVTLRQSDGSTVDVEGTLDSVENSLNARKG